MKIKTLYDADLKLHVDVTIIKTPWWMAWWKLWFPGAPWREMYLAVGRVILSPSGGITEDLWIHETTHLKRQGYSFPGAIWWHLKYRLSSRFRLAEEVLAYRAQMAWFMKQKNISHKEKHRIRQRIAQVLSGPMYGSMIDYEEAFTSVGKGPQP